MRARSDLGTSTDSETFFSSHASSSVLARSTRASASGPRALRMTVVRVRFELASIWTPGCLRMTSLATPPRVVGASRRSLEK